MLGVSCCRCDLQLTSAGAMTLRSRARKLRRPGRPSPRGVCCLGPIAAPVQVDEHMQRPCLVRSPRIRALKTEQQGLNDSDGQPHSQQGGTDHPLQATYLLF